jgi:hypothetical protein
VDHRSGDALADASRRACVYGRQLTVTGKAAGVKGALSQRIDGV